jgi:hypothetical protein
MMTSEAMVAVLAAVADTGNVAQSFADLMRAVPPHDDDR